MKINAEKFKVSAVYPNALLSNVNEDCIDMAVKGVIAHWSLLK